MKANKKLNEFVDRELNLIGKGDDYVHAVGYTSTNKTNNQLFKLQTPAPDFYGTKFTGAFRGIPTVADYQSDYFPIYSKETEETVKEEVDLFEEVNNEIVELIKSKSWKSLIKKVKEGVNIDKEHFIEAGKRKHYEWFFTRYVPNYLAHTSKKNIKENFGENEFNEEDVIDTIKMRRWAKLYNIIKSGHTVTFDKFIEAGLSKKSYDWFYLVYIPNHMKQEKSFKHLDFTSLNNEVDSIRRDFDRLKESILKSLNESKTKLFEDEIIIDLKEKTPLIANRLASLIEGINTEEIDEETLIFVVKELFSKTPYLEMSDVNKDRIVTFLKTNN